MPPEASSRPEIGLNFIVTSTSVYGPGGATMTLNGFLVARCTSTLLPLGAPAMSSAAHWPSTTVQPSTPLLSKSNVSTGAPSGNLISGGRRVRRPPDEAGQGGERTQRSPQQAAPRDRRRRHGRRLASPASPTRSSTPCP